MGPDNQYRFKLYGTAHLMGLGTVADVSLAEVRDAAMSPASWSSRA
jgi:hypothetical protein